MKKKKVVISSPDELNKHLQYTSPVTWIVLFLVTFILIGFFAWSFIFKLEVKLLGDASIEGGEVSLVIKDADLGKLKVGQNVYIADKKGEILSFNDNGQPVVSTFELENGNYKYKIVIAEKRPVDFLIGR